METRDFIGPYHIKSSNPDSVFPDSNMQLQSEKIITEKHNLKYEAARAEDERPLKNTKVTAEGVSETLTQELSAVAVDYVFLCNTTRYYHIFQTNMHQKPTESEQSSALHVVLLQPQIPHNTGAIGRLCVGLDAHLHLIKPLGFSLDEKAVRRSGLDYWPNLQLHVYRSWNAFMEKNQPESMHFLSTRGEKSLYEVNFTPPCWLIFGNETRGLPTSFYKEYAPDLYKIPQPGAHARSINLANATSIALYEAYRQIAAGS